VLTTIVMVVDVAWILATDVSFQQKTLALTTAMALLGFYVSARILKPGMIKTLLDGYILLAVAWPALRVFNHLMFTLAGDYIDPWLSAADTSLGLSWLGYATWVNGHPLVLSVLDLAYTGLTPASVFAYIGITLFARHRTASEFLAVFTGMAVTVCLLLVVFPAVGAMVYNADAVAALSNLRDVGVYHMPHYDYLRSQPAPVLILESLPGLATFPSFHTAMGILIIYCTRERMLLFIPATLYSLVMIAATPIQGGHHLVDVLAGAGMALAAIALLRFASARIDRRPLHHVAANDSAIASQS